MKYLFVLLIAFAITDPEKIGKVNTLKKEAREAFLSGDYKTAIEKYKLIADSLGVREDEVVMNLANAYFLEKDTAQAFSAYQSLTASAKKDINSKAHLQMGIIANQQGRHEEALNYFKQAIKTNPQNEDARYNYEMLKKKLEEQKKQEQQQQQQNQNKDQQNQDQQQQQQDQQKKDQQDQKNEQQKKDQEKKDQQNQQQQQKDQEQQQDQQDPDKEQQQQDENQKNEQKKDQNLNRDKLEQMKISEEKARMILEAMKNAEKQYLQQQKRKAKQPRDRNKPDW